MRTAFALGLTVSSAWGLACGAASPPVESPGTNGALAVDGPKSTPKTEPARTTVVMPPASAAANPAADVPLPEALSKPEKFACIIQSSSWAQGTLKLGFASGAGYFASVGKPASVKATLPIGGSVFVELDVGLAVVHGFVGAETFALYAADATPLHDAFVMLPSVPVKWVGQGPDTLRIMLPFDGKQVKPIGKDFEQQTSAAVEQPCAYLSLDKKAFNPLTATRTDSTREVAFLPGKHTLTTGVDGQGPIAALETDMNSPYAVLLANQGLKSRVAWKSGNAFVFGWLDSKEVAVKTTTVSLGNWLKVEPIEPPKARKTGVDAWAKKVCTSELSLIAETPDGKHVVGKIKSGKPVQLGPEKNGMTRVALPDSDLLASDVGNFFVPSTQAATCAAP
jgi:hypothetical protein